MSSSDLAKLILLSAIWGASFMFLRISVPEFGPILTTLIRTSLAGLALYCYVCVTKLPMHWRSNAKTYVLVGLTACVIPFLAFSFAALYLPPAHMAVLNATAPLFGAVMSALFLAERLGPRKLAGLIIGIAGVAILIGAGEIGISAAIIGASGLCIFAAAAFSLSSVVVRKTGQPGSIHPVAMATGSLIMGSIIMLPLSPFALPEALPSAQAFISLAILAVVSTGLTQAIFVPLITKIGPGRAMSVTYLTPMFSIMWGTIFLSSTVGWATFAGAATVFVGKSLVLAPSGDVES